MNKTIRISPKKNVLHPINNANENRNLYHGRKKGISKLRPPQLTTNKFGFVKESCVAEKAEFEQLEKQSKVFCKENVPKTEFKQCDLKLGDPVCISGVKKGILRYYGETKFADGIWCGIELDEPVGKNNGIIEGVQYFQCKENHGIFAPVSKVQLISNAEPPHNAQQPVSSNFRVDNFQQVHKFSYKNLTDFRRTSSPKESLSHLTFCADQESRIPFPNYVGTKKDSHSEQCLSFVLRRNSGFGKDNKNLSVKELKDCENLCSDTFVRNEKEESAKIMPSSLLIDKTTHSTESLTVAFPETNAKADVLDKDDLNSTFTLDKPAEISETTIVKDQDALNTTFDVDLSPINDNFNKLSDPCLKLISDLNSTFTLETTTEFEKGKEEPKENECNFLKSEKKLSFEDAFDINDIDDDQPSLDESLGILTPNQMKDFSIDQQGVIVFDGDMFRIPKMASCDNIDDIPEDEVKETLSHLNDPYVQILAENRENDFESADLLYESRTLPKSTKNTIDNNDEFDEVSKNSRQTSTPYGNTRTLKSEFPSSPLIGSSEFNMGVDSYDKNLKLVMKDQTKTDTTLGDIVTDNKNIERKINEIDQEEIPSCSFIHNITFSNQIDGDDVNFDSELKSLNDDKEKVSAISNENLQISIENLNMQHISDNNCNNAPLTIDSEISENNFLTNNIPICSDTNVLMKSDIEVIKVERPASTYTTGSTDTGYQEDGDFDVQSEISAAVPSPCSEIPTHSIYNSNRNMGLEDNERHQIEMSDSDFFTDSGGVGFTTESEMETDGECKMVSDFTVESNGMDTVVERNNQNEDQRNVILTTKQDDTLKEIISENVSEDLAKDVTVSQTVTSSLNSVCDSTTTTIYTTTTTTNNNNNDKNITVVNETIDLSERKFSGVEKTNSFIISGKEENSLKENSDTQKHLLKNKTWIKTKEPNKTKKDNILKARTQNENLQTSEKRPKKNVVSKIKLMIETSVSKTPKNNENSQKTNRLKKNRWDDVTSKIAASLAEEKSKVKTKREIKSRIDTNLSVAKQIPSRRSSQLDSTRTSFSIENENTSITDSVNTKRIKNVQK
ncbi:restin homolog isoform X1 [Centruroides sculpturatus]|uniref:restin homolog isoform X1 n=1 Tax=Centruroides sculpturatus TaxID=218467 RepID=UPI000C6E2FDD|nr:restin homolog isoform X1 [Centruroides sculpturatus]